MKILITGGAGFIGSHLSDALLAAGHEITIIDDLSSGTKDFLPKEAEFLKMDIRDEKLTDIFKERHFDIIYHEAAQTMVPASIDNPYLDADINISGMLRVQIGIPCTGSRTQNRCAKNYLLFLRRGLWR